MHYFCGLEYNNTNKHNTLAIFQTDSDWQGGCPPDSTARKTSSASSVPHQGAGLWPGVPPEWSMPPPPVPPPHFPVHGMPAYPGFGMPAGHGSSPVSIEVFAVMQENRYLGFQSTSDTNQPVQSQKKA